MHPLTFLTAASALIAGATASDLPIPALNEPSSQNRPKPPNSEPASEDKQDLYAPFTGHSCAAPYRGLEDDNSDKPDHDKPFYKLARATWEEWVQNGGVDLPAGPQKCVGLKGPIKKELGVDVRVCNDNKDEIHLSEDEAFAAIEEIERLCGDNLQKSPQIFHEKNWNVLIRGVDKETGQLLQRRRAVVF